LGQKVNVYSCPIALKELFACKKIDDYAAKGPNIGFLRIKKSVYEKFWRPILKCASIKSELLVRCTEFLGEAEISDFNITLFADKNVVRLKILNIFGNTR
jgi:hypothetical protein